MNKIIKFLLVIVPLCFFSCGGDGEESGIDKEPESIKVDIVALWEEISGNKESVISLAKDGTYKMIIKQGNGIYYFISTGRYTLNDYKIECKDNCVDDASKTYQYSVNKDGELVFENKTFKKIGVEDNAFENKISGTLHEYGGYDTSGTGYIVTQLFFN